MSAARANRSGWLAQNYEKLALIVVLIGLLVSALILVLRTGLERMALAEGFKPMSAPKEAPAADLSVFAPRIESLKNPFQSQSYSNQMVVSEVRVMSVNSQHIPAPIPYSAPVCPFTGEPQPPVVPEEDRDTDGDGLKNAYERAHGLDPLAAADALMDKDGDGFSNVEEFHFGTDPSDRNDFPDLTAKLRLVGVKTIPFLLRFQGVQELQDGTRFLLNLRSLEQSHFVKLGDEVRGFSVVSFDEAAEDGPTLVLRKGGETIELVKGRRVDKAEVVALLVFLLDNSTHKVKIDDDLVLRERTYKIIDIKRNAVSIRDVESGEFYQIGRMSENERAELLSSKEDGPDAERPGSAGNRPRPRGQHTNIPRPN